MPPFVHVTASATVNETLTRYPSTARIFHLLNLDGCCGGNRSLRDAAAHAHVDLGVLLSMLEASVSASFIGARTG